MPRKASRAYLITVPHLLCQKRGALQAIDQMSLFRPLCKFCASVRRVRDIVPTLRAAMAAAQSGTPGRWRKELDSTKALELRGCCSRCPGLCLPVPAGPVFVELPLDVLYPYFMVEKEMIPAKLPKGLMGRVVVW